MSYQIIPLGPRANDITLRIFGKLIAIAPIGKDKRGRTTWLYTCHCGNTVVRGAYSRTDNHRRSCGCLGKSIKHGAHKTKEYRAWSDMLFRCHNPSHKDFKEYGGRGITVCSDWANSFGSFYAAMGDCPPGKSIDRIDNDGPYSPENCRWATAKEQQNNRRVNRLITYGGHTKTITEWARAIGINVLTLTKRLNNGWSINKAFEEPVSEQHAINSSLRKRKHAA